MSPSVEFTSLSPRHAGGFATIGAEEHLDAGISQEPTQDSHTRRGAIRCTSRVKGRPRRQKVLVNRDKRGFGALRDSRKRSEPCSEVGLETGSSQPNIETMPDI